MQVNGKQNLSKITEKVHVLCLFFKDFAKIESYFFLYFWKSEAAIFKEQRFSEQKSNLLFQFHCDLAIPSNGQLFDAERKLSFFVWNVYLMFY